MNYNKLAKSRILEFKQNNPFQDKRKAILYNEAYKAELKKHFEGKSQDYYNQYYQEVFRLERSKGQLFFTGV